jgi:hypothetical protein
LLALNVLAAALHAAAPQITERLSRLAASAHDRPLRFFIGLVAVSALVYVPLALIYSPWAWTNTGLLSFQTSRPLHYLVYFFAGYAVGAQGLERGLLSAEGALARQWVWWVVAAFAGFFAWAGPTSLTLDGKQAPLIVHIVADIGFTIACAAGAFCFLALCLRFATRRHWAFDSLSANAYNMYLNHYIFMVWLQFAVLGLGLFAVGKAAIVFLGTFVLSWAVAVAFGGLSPGTFFAQAKRLVTAGVEQKRDDPVR